MDWIVAENNERTDLGESVVRLAACHRNASKNARMSDYLRCRLSVSEGELEIAGPATALRALSSWLRQQDAKLLEVAVTGGSVVQEVTDGLLLVSLQGATTLHFAGSREHLDIIWDALDGVADQAETADDRSVGRHAHIEYFPGDEYRSPDSIPLVIAADWPEEPVRTPE